MPVADETTNCDNPPTSPIARKDDCSSPSSLVSANTVPLLQNLKIESLKQFKSFNQWVTFTRIQWRNYSGGQTI